MDTLCNEVRLFGIVFRSSGHDEGEFMDAANPPLLGRSIMVVEDEYLIALNIEAAAAELGAKVWGPFSRVDEALATVQTKGALPDAAILDINVNGQRVFPLADYLQERNVPLVFATGYDDWTIPDNLASVPRFEKPAHPVRLLRALAGKLVNQDGTMSQ